MKKINLAITGCMGRMGQQIIKSAKSDKNLKLIALTENRIVSKKITGIKPSLNTEQTFRKANLIIDFTVPKCTFEVLKIASKLKKRVVIGTTGFSKKEENLIKAYEDGHDKDARWNMMMASTEGAMAFSKGLGAVHSMSHALGANQDLRLHHGTLNAVLLPTILRFNRNHVGNKYSRIAIAMGKNKSIDLANEVEKLNEKIGMPSCLSEMQVTENMIPDLVAHAMIDPSNITTPRVPTLEEWEQLFLEAM